MSIKNSHIKISISSFLIVLFYCSLGFSYRIYPSEITQTLQFIFFLSLAPVLIIALACGLFSISTLIYRKVKKQQISNSIVAGIAISLSLTVISPLSLAIYRTLPRPLPTGSHQLEFNSLIWKKESSTEWNNGVSIREQMLGDVIENVLPSKDKNQIIELLGPSLETNYFKSIDKDFIYYLGPQRDGFINIDSEWLLIWLDKNGMYKQYKIVND